MERLDGILNYRGMQVPLGPVEAINGNIQTLPQRGSGCKYLACLLPKAQRKAAARTGFVVFRQAAQNGDFTVHQLYRWCIKLYARGSSLQHRGGAAESAAAAGEPETGPPRDGSGRTHGGHRQP
jgi:hypothetical protein